MPSSITTRGRDSVHSDAREGIARACDSMRQWLLSDPDPPSTPQSPSESHAQESTCSRQASHPRDSAVGATGAVLDSDKLVDAWATPSPLRVPHKPGSAEQKSLPTDDSPGSIKTVITKMEIPEAYAGRDRSSTAAPSEPGEERKYSLEYEDSKKKLEEEEAQQTAALRSHFRKRRAALRPAMNNTANLQSAPDSQGGGSIASPNSDKFPLPAPLHVIESSVPHERLRHEKQKRSMGAWSVSDLYDDQKEASADQDAHPADNCTKKFGRLFDMKKGPAAEADNLIPLARTDIGDTLFSKWLMSIADPPHITLPKATNGLVYRRCDIDACNGKFLAAIEQPETLQCHVEGPCRGYRDIGWRRCNMTSELYIARELQSRQRLGQQLRASLDYNQSVAKAATEPVSENQPPNAYCVLRPACEADLQLIADIVNLEAQSEHPQILEVKATTAADIHKLLVYCKRNRRPFIVAVPAEDELLERSKWPKNSDRAYFEYVKFKQSQPAAPATLVGFAFMCEPRAGFLNTACPGSRFSGQVRIVVHPEHRRKLYGSALLDKILSCVCFHRSFVEYEWECADPQRIYDTSYTHNDRQYTRLYIETLCESKEDAEFSWRETMLVKFGFAEAAHLRQFVRTDRGSASRWLDLVLWEFEAQKFLEVRDRDPGTHLLSRP